MNKLLLVGIMASAALLGASAQILFKKANVQFGPSMLTNGWLITGLTLYGIAFIINIVAYRYGEASFLYPIIALSYIFLVVLASIFLGEKLTWMKLAGAGTIIAGVALIVR